MEYIRGDPGKNKSEGITIRKAEGERERKIERQETEAVEERQGRARGYPSAEGERERKIKRQETEAVEEDKAEREAILQLFVFFSHPPLAEKFINLCRDK